ncbi:MAG: DUF6067 family protein, partial [Kiritimatiellales bacterium]|nr:DUF6067 family protein [Kiritimatiellales bacterium]
MKKILHLIVVMAATTALHAAPPVLQVPKTSAPPPLDQIRFVWNWRETASFCGMLDIANPDKPPRFLGFGYDANWWVGYDDENIYIACYYRAPDPDVKFKANITENDDPRIADDDHLLIELSFENPEIAAHKPSYRIMVNPLGAVLAEEVEFLPGQNRHGWADDITLISKEKDDNGHHWITRLAIPREQLGIDTLDNVEALLHLSVVTDPFHLSWGGARSGEWEKCPRVRFTPDLPAAFSVCPGSAGMFATDIASPRTALAFSTYVFRGTPDKQTSVKYTLLNQSGGKTLWKKEYTITGPRATRDRKNIKDRIHNAESDNLLTLTVKSEYDGDKTTLYKAEIPFDVADAATKARMENWIARRKVEIKARFECDYVYSPYNHTIVFTSDTRQELDRLRGDELEKASQLLAADTLDISLAAKENNVEIMAVSTPAQEGQARVEVELPQPLSEGRYEVKYTLRQAGHVVAIQTRDIVREIFPWEKNRIGRDPVVIPPFEPIRHQDGALTVVGREIAIGANGLPQSIDAWNRQLLAAPIRLTATVAGEESPPVFANSAKIELIPGQRIPAEFAKYELTSNTCPVPELLDTDGYQAQISASGKLDDLDVAIDSMLEYEGWCQVKIALSPPAGRRVQVDKLELILPLANDATIMHWARGRGRGRISGCSAVPAGDGVLFTEHDVAKDSDQEDPFVPAIYIGTPGEGLWWIAEAPVGWHRDTDAANQVLERTNGQLNLRLHLISTPTVIKDDVTIEFALLPSPTRPTPENFREIFYKKLFSHDTNGFRMYGSGVDGMTLYTEEDYERLRKFFFESDERWPLRKLGHTREWGAPFLLYGSTFMASAGSKEFSTFGSAWIMTDRLYKLFRVHEVSRGRQSMAGNYTWQTDLECTPIATTIPQSFIDFHLWHMSRIGEKCRVNGTFYDNYGVYPPPKLDMHTTITDVAYRDQHGETKPKSILFRKHFWGKRFSTAFWLMG